ncbi:TPA: DUF1272 domain-containing protein [Enterobacter chengduensis]|nr:DUF1272 domain-containing protein [Enterobacter chengduensis]
MTFRRSTNKPARFTPCGLFAGVPSRFELRSDSECCDKDLSPESKVAEIGSFGCTFYVDCVALISTTAKKISVKVKAQWYL